MRRSVRNAVACLAFAAACPFPALTNDPDEGRGSDAAPGVQIIPTDLMYKDRVYSRNGLPFTGIKTVWMDGKRIKEQIVVNGVIRRVIAWDPGTGIRDEWWKEGDVAFNTVHDRSGQLIRYSEHEERDGKTVRVIERTWDEKGKLTSETAK